MRANTPKMLSRKNGKAAIMAKLYIVYTGKVITQELLSLMTYLKEKFVDKTIVLTLVNSLDDSLYKSGELNKWVAKTVPFTEDILTSGHEVIVLQNSNYKKIQRDIGSGALSDRVVRLFSPEAFFLTESDVFRNEKGNYFTFSPFQDTQPFYSLLNCGSSIKKQLCVRYINKGDLSNPLFMSVHSCYSYQRYMFENQCEKMCSVIDTLSKEYLIDKKRIVVRFPKTCNEYMQLLQQKYKTDMRDDEKYVAHLDIPGKHFYVKVVYEHDNGLIPFANFVLVDVGNNTSKLDSIIFQDRLELIKENKTYIMQLDRYKGLVDEVCRNQPYLSNQQLHELTNHFIAIFSLLYMNIRGSNKGVGNELRRKVKALVVFLKYYVTDYNPFNNIGAVAEEVKRLYGFDSDSTAVITDFKNIYSLVSEVMAKNISNLPQLQEKYTSEELSATFGIPKEEFGNRHAISRKNYPFN